MPIAADTAPNGARKIHPANPCSDRVERLRRAFQRELGRKPTELQRSLIVGAAIMQAKFEEAASINGGTANDLVRLSGEARRARQDMLASFQAAGAASDQLEVA